MTVYILCVILCVGHVTCITWDEAKAEHEKLITAYSVSNIDYFTDTIPSSDYSVPLDVKLEIEMTSLGGYDAVNGAIDIIGSLNMTWTDEIGLLENTGFNTNVGEILVDYRTIWTPVIVLINSADSVERVGDVAYKVRLNLATGQVTWKPRMIIRASCTPDVSFFPFDQQKCTLVFAPWFLQKDNLSLTVPSNTWNMDNYDKNGVWTIESTEATTYISGDYYYASFTVTFNRAPLYFVINLVLPILFLALLSGCVFLLPAASGERVGFVITCFLTFVVLLQTVMTYLPEASAPMSLLCYYVIVMMVFSAFLSLVNALLLRIYHKPQGDEVPRWLIHTLEVIKCIKCRRIKCQKNSVSSSSQEALKDSVKGEAFMPKNSNFDPKRVSKLINVKEAGKGDSNVNSLRNNLMAETKQNGITNTISENTVRKARVDDVLEDIEGQDDVDTSQDEEELSEIDWETIGKFLDKFFILVFIGVQCAFSMFFLVPLGTRA